MLVGMLSLVSLVIGSSLQIIKMQLNAQLYRILFKVPPPTQELIQLSQQEVQKIENALALANLIKAIETTKKQQSERAVTPLIKLDQMKTLNTSSAKLYNWNIIIECLNQLGIQHNIGPDIKQHIIMGDLPIVQDVVNDIHKSYLRLLQERPISGRKRIASVGYGTPRKTDSSKSYRIRNLSVHEDKSQNLDQSMQILPPQQNKSFVKHVDLSNVSKDQTQANSALEFFLSILQRRLQLSAKQAAALFAENNKYLAHVVGKGVQGLYEPIIEYYQDILASNRTLISLCDEKALVFSLQAIKPGLVSKSYEVAELTAKVFSSISNNIKNNNLFRDQAYNWFINSGGLSIVILALKRHPGLNDILSQIIVEYTRMHFLELFTQTLKTAIPVEGERTQFLSQIIDGLTKQPQVASELIQLGIVDNWLESLAIPQLTNDFKICCIRLSCTIWKIFSTNIQDGKIQKIQQLHRDLAKEPSINVSSFVVVEMCSLLQHFSLQKHNHAPILYKNLAIILVENFNRTDFRSFLLVNLENLFLTIPSIPLSVIMDPLIKEAQNQVLPCIFVLRFLNSLSQRNLTFKLIIQIMDLMAKLTISDVIFYKITKQVMIRLLDRSLQNEQSAENVEEFAAKYAKVALSVFFSSLKTEKAQKNKVDQQKRAQVIDMLKSIIDLNNEDLNQKLKVLISHTYIQVRDYYRKPNVSLSKLLKFFGDPESIVKEFEDETQSLMMNDSQINKSMSVGPSRKGDQSMVMKTSRPPNPKVLAEIEDVKKTFKNKMQTQKDLQEMQTMNLERQKVLLRKQLEKRSIEQGVATKNQKDVQTNLIFADGTREKELQTEKKNGLPIIQVLDLNFEEDQDKMLVDIFLVKNSKPIRYLFNKYANSGAHLTNPNSFDGLQKQLGSINVAELRKMLQDFELENTVSKDEILVLAREVHVQLLHERTELKVFDFKGFQHFFVQLALLVAERPPYRQRYSAPYLCLQILINHFRTITAARKQSTALFDDPDSQYFQQSDVIKEFNKQLLVNPEMELPDGFKKVNIPEITFDYQLLKKLKVKKSERIAYEIVNLIIEKLGSHLIEPITQKKNIYKARPNTFGFIQAKIQNIPKSVDYKRNSSAPKTQTAKQPRKRVLEIEPKRELSLPMKVALSKIPFKDIATAEQVANLLDDMIFAIENKRSTIERKIIIENKTVQERKAMSQQQSRLEELREKRRRERQQELKERLEVDKKKNDEKMKEIKERQQQKLDELKKLEQLKEKKKKEYLEEQKKKIKESEDKKQQGYDKGQEEAKKKMIQDLTEKKKEFKKFNKQKIEEFYKELKEEKAKKAKETQQKEVKEQKKQERLDAIRQGYKAQDAMRIKIEKEVNQKIVERYNSEAYQKIFELHKQQLISLFDFLLKETFFPIGVPASRDQITLKTFTWFADKFKLWPEILNKYDLTTIFRALTRDKQMVDHIPVGMNYNEFIQALFRLSIKGKRVFNQMRGGKASQKEVDEIVRQERIQHAKEKNEEDNLREIEEEERQREQKEKDKLKDDRKEKTIKDNSKDQTEKQLKEGKDEKYANSQKNHHDDPQQGKSDKHSKQEDESKNEKHPKGQEQDQNKKKQANQDDDDDRDDNKDPKKNVVSKQKNKTDKNDDDDDIRKESSVKQEIKKHSEVDQKDQQKHIPDGKDIRVSKDEKEQKPVKDEERNKKQDQQTTQKQVTELKDKPQKDKEQAYQSDKKLESKNQKGEDPKKTPIQEKNNQQDQDQKNKDKNDQNKNSSQNLQPQPQVKQNRQSSTPKKPQGKDLPPKPGQQQSNDKKDDSSHLQLPADQLIDNYGNIDEANTDTLLSLIAYLDLPTDKIKLENRFRQIMEEGRRPTKKRIEELTRKLA